MLPPARVAGSARGRHELPRLRNGTRGGGVRGNVPRRRLRRTRRPRSPPPGRDSGESRPATPTHPREHAHGPGTTSPSTRAGGGRSTSPDRDTWVKNSRGGASDDRTAGGTAGPRAGAIDRARGPLAGPSRAARGRWAPPERDAGKKNKVRSTPEGPTPGRPGRGPGRAGPGRAAGQARPALSRSSAASTRSGPRGRRGTGGGRSTRTGSLGDGRRSLPQKPAPPISGERATRRLHGTTGTIPPVTPAARNASPSTAARSLPLARSPELRREETI